MSHRNARLAPAGRMILIQRVTEGRPVAHVAKEMGISRPTAYRWVTRYRDQGLPGLEDRSSRPKSCPHATSAEKTAEVLAARTEHRSGPSDLAARTGVGARTVSRILARAHVPKLWGLGPADRDPDPCLTCHGTPLRTRRTRGHDPHRCEETRPDPGRRRLAGGPEPVRP